MNKLVITLDEKDLLEVQGILMDGDAKGALHFLETRIAANIPKKGSAPCDSTRKNPFLFKSNQ